MALHPFRHRVEHLLAAADIAIGGARPGDLQVHDDRLYARLLAQGSLGLGESYMDGWWDPVGPLDVLLFKLHLDCSVGEDCYDNRYDLNVDGVVNIIDILLYKPILGQQCT